MPWAHLKQALAGTTDGAVGKGPEEGFRASSGSGRPSVKSARLVAAWEALARSGQLEPGQRLPSTRELAALLGVSRNLINSVYAELQFRGWIEIRRGAGAYFSEPEIPVAPEVSESPPKQRSEAPTRVQRFLTSLEDPLPMVSVSRSRFDFSRFRVALDARTQSRWLGLIRKHAERAASDYGDPQGLLGLREHLSRFLHRQRGLRVAPEQLVILSGAQQALDLLTRIFIEPGDRVLVEDPGYRGAIRCFELAGARVRRVRVDEEGICVDRLPRSGVAPKLLFCTPSHQYPLGGVMGLGRRKVLLSWARRHGVRIIEDDYDGSYFHGAGAGGRGTRSAPPAALWDLDQQQGVFHVGSLSRLLFPGLRLGYAALPRELVGQVVRCRWLSDRQPSMLEQAVLADFVERGELDRHMQRMATLYRRRLQVLREACRAQFGARVRLSGTEAGASAVLWFEDLGWEVGPPLSELAARREVGVRSVLGDFHGEPLGEQLGLIMCYGALTESQIVEGIRRLALALREL